MWENVLCSDETTTESNGQTSKKYVWCKTNTAHDSRNTISMVKYGGGNTVIWESFSSPGTRNLVTVERKMDGLKLLNC